jgi:pyruvate kinase
VEAVRVMARIIVAVEDHGLERMAAIDWTPRTKSGVICKAAAEVAERLDADYLIAFTKSGDSASRLSRYRSRVPMLAFTPDVATQHQMAMYWGIQPILSPTVSHTDEMVLQVDRLLLERGWCQPGDTVVIVAGSPPGIPGSTNALRVHRIGDAVARLAPAYGQPE